MSFKKLLFSRTNDYSLDACRTLAPTKEPDWNGDGHGEHSDAWEGDAHDPTFSP